MASAISASAATTIAAAATTAAALTRLGFIHFQLLAEYSLTVKTLLSGISILLPLVGDEGVALAGVVHVSHHAELVKLTLDLLIGEILIHTVHEQLGHLVSCRSESSNISLVVLDQNL